MIIRKLNELTSGESTNEQDVKSIAVQFARDPMQASLFNHASMAHNNHFFYSGLSTDPVSVDNPSNRRLHKKLEDSFGSIDTLRTTMLDTAAAMFGPGFVWLVWARNQGANISRGDFRILTTYLAGTPYPEAGFRRQGIDTNTTNPSTYNDYRNAEPVNTAGAFGSWSAAGRENSSIPPGGTSLMPVLCVNTWEHVYIYDYGLLGKRKFLADWWDAVDWSRVDARVPAEAWREFEGGMRSRGGLR
jgi:Fe-Mn family superoxide dismutase